MEGEHQLKKNDVYGAVSRPKKKSMGYKERFVARGFSQKEGIEDEDIVAATGSRDTWHAESCVQIKDDRVRA